MKTIGLREHEDSGSPVVQLFLDEIAEDGQRRILGTLHISEGRDDPASQVVIRAWSVIRSGQEERARVFQEVAESILTEAFPEAERSDWDSPNTIRLGEIYAASQVTELWVFVQQAAPTALAVAGSVYVSAKAVKESVEAGEAVGRAVSKIRDACRQRSEQTDGRPPEGYR